MSLLTAHNLSKSYATHDIFAGITLEIPHKARIALVGPNGGGKTTLLHLLIGADTPTNGTVNTARSLRIGFLPQRPELVGDHSLWEEQLKAFADLRRQEAELAELEHALADDERLIERYGVLQDAFDRAGGYTYQTRIKMVLSGVGFSADEYDKSLAHLSGGQKTRALLARLLLEEPDLLVLDEPTNHLDIESVEWLENYLKDFPGAVLVVSHDRYFLDNVATVVWELDFGTLEIYRGNYSHYVAQRQARYERRLKEYEAQQEFLAKEQAFIRKHMGSRLTAQAKGRQKKLDTMRKRGKLIERPRTHRDMHLKIATDKRSGDKVLMTENLSIGYADDGVPLLHVPDITLTRGEVAALIGPNGVGKSTFVKTILGELEPLAGTTQLGASVEVGYFAQAHERLNPDNSLLDELLTVENLPISEARNYLGQFLFSGDDVFRPVKTLSGGERGRLALAKLALMGANFLLLDEPTNHLDIPAQEILQQVLAAFDGTILLVSHDRYLIDALATQIWAAQPGELTVFTGTYAEYIAARHAPSPSPEASKNNRRSEDTVSEAPPSNNRKHNLTPYQAKQRVAQLEQQIHALEQQLDDLTAAIDEASAAGDADRISELGAQYAEVEAALTDMMEEWDMLLE
ncbi:MAG: ABC transporter ATP-binding protein [Chloroflexi bacterium]|nr:MAG: ABC transporter ATP-binding protein [Chloroflexota bacterium]